MLLVLEWKCEHQENSIGNQVITSFRILYVTFSNRAESKFAKKSEQLSMKKFHVRGMIIIGGWFQHDCSCHRYPKTMYNVQCTMCDASIDTSDKFIS